MDLNEYQREALRTADDMSDADLNELLLFTSTTLSGETGELANYIKKVIWHNHSLEMEHIEEELGDILWYVAVCAYWLNIPLDSVVQRNLKKLSQRYPKGFSPAASISREV